LLTYGAAVPGTPRQPRIRKSGDTRRAEIADAAMRVLVAQGARGFTAKAIADEVGVTDGALFRHFHSMGAIVEAVIDRMETALFSALPPPHDDPLDRLRAFFDRRVGTILAQPQLSRLLFSDHLTQLGGARCATRIEEFKSRSQRFVLDCLREAETARMLAAGLRPESASVLVLGAVLGIGHGGARLGAARLQRKLADEVWNVLERTLRGSDGRPTAGPGQRRRPGKPGLRDKRRSR
jgi:AcrR family transcriptional regulator